MHFAELTRERCLALVMNEDEDEYGRPTGWSWSCRCGAGLGGWWGTSEPKRSDLLCTDCLIELEDELGVSDDDEACEALWERVQELVDQDESAERAGDNGATTRGRATVSASRGSSPP